MNNINKDYESNSTHCQNNMKHRQNISKPLKRAMKDLEPKRQTLTEMVVDSCIFVFEVAKCIALIVLMVGLIVLGYYMILSVSYGYSYVVKYMATPLYGSQLRPLN
ncbi:hypothetical protein VE00_00594 [Pseudogymnoascus sp. WSF 3629]|nr:hypothetical protein VE00_00594 [Pseudogymnoascus sp. WSF 3629]